MHCLIRRFVFLALMCPGAVFAQEPPPAADLSTGNSGVSVQSKPADGDSPKVDAPAKTPPTNEPTPAEGRAFALLICGHPGDDGRLKRFADSMTKIRNGLVGHYSVPGENISVVFGEGEDGFAALVDGSDTDAAEADAVSVPEWLTSAPAATADNLRASVADLKEKMTTNDTLWVIVMGHSNHDRGRTWLNLSGLDIQQFQFAELFQDINSRQETFLITIPASGYFVKPMSRHNRLMITATEPGLEIYETLFPHALADVMSQPPGELLDADADNVVSMFDFYMAVVTEVSTRYADEELLSTEHAALDDNGDRRGTELQVHFLTEKLGGLPKVRQRKVLRKGRDGYRSSTLILSRDVVGPTVKEAVPSAAE